MKHMSKSHAKHTHTCILPSLLGTTHYSFDSKTHLLIFLFLLQEDLLL